MPGFTLNEQQLKSRKFEGFYSVQNNHYLIYSFDFSENMGSIQTRYFAMPLSDIQVSSALLLHVPPRDSLGCMYLDPLQEFFVNLQVKEYRLNVETQMIDLNNLDIAREILQYLRNTIQQSQEYKDLSNYAEKIKSDTKKDVVKGYLNLLNDLPKIYKKTEGLIVDPIERVQLFFSILNKMDEIKDKTIKEISNTSCHSYLKNMVMPQEQSGGIWQAKTAGATTTFGKLSALTTFLEEPRSLSNSTLIFTLKEMTLQLSKKFIGVIQRNLESEPEDLTGGRIPGVYI